MPTTAPPEYISKRLGVKFPERAVELPSCIRPDVPAPMIDAILDGAAVALRRVAPLPLRKEFFLRSRFQRGERRLHVQSHPALLARSAEKVLDALQLTVGVENGMLHRDGAIRLVVGQPRHGRHEWKRDQLANEDDTTSQFSAELPPRIEPEVYFLEVLVEERWKREDVGVEEQKPDEADKMPPRPLVELGAPWAQRFQKLATNLEIEQREVPPLRG